MPMKMFTIPENVDTRLIQHREILYKFKIQYRSRDIRNIKLPCSQSELNSEVQRVIQALLCTKGKQFPIKTKHFFINCEKLPWKAGRKLRFKKGGKIVKHNPYVHILTVISKTEYEESVSGLNTSNNNGNTIRQSSERESSMLNENGAVPHSPKSISRPVRRLITRSPERSEGYFTRSKRTSVISSGRRRKRLHPQKSVKTGGPSTGFGNLFDDASTGPDSVSHREVEHNPPDRHIIEQEEIQEDMKLQQLASPTSKKTSPRKDKKRRKSSIIGTMVDTFIRPIQEFLRVQDDQ